MTPIPLSSQFAVSFSGPASSEDLLNLEWQPLPSGSRSPYVVRSTAGLVTRYNITPSFPVYRQNSDLSGYVYVACGPNFFRIIVSTGVIQYLGNIGTPPSTDSSMTPELITIAVGAVAVVAVNPPNAFTCAHDSNTLTQITDTSFVGAGSVAYLDGRFVFSPYGGGTRVFSSSLLDAETFDALDFLYADAQPDAIRLAIQYSGKVWLFGETSIQVLYDAGTANFPFAPVSGGVLPVGTLRASTVAICDRSLFWLGSDGVVYRNNGYQAVPVSTIEVNDAIRSYGLNLAIDACAFTDGGQWRYCLTFSAADGTIVETLTYRPAVNKWQRRSSDGTGNGVWRGLSACQIGEVPLIGDRVAGLIYQPDPNVASDNGTQLVRQATLPTIWAQTKRAFMARIVLDMQTELASADATVTLSISDDGGVTWTAPRAGSSNPSDPPGRLFWTRPGSFRQRILRFGFHDRCAIYGVYVDVEEGEW